MAENDNLVNKSTRGGPRPGSGRPRGSSDAATKLRMAAKKKFLQRAARDAQMLYNAQVSLARGVSYLYRIDKDAKGNDKKPELVISKSEIEGYLSGKLDDDVYHYIHTERPDNKAIDSILDRTFGKAEQVLDVTTNGNDIGVGLSADQAEQLIRARANRSNPE